MVVACEKNIEGFIPTIGPYIVAAIDNANDENCARFACGLVSDLSNYLEKGMQYFSHDFMQSLNKVLKGEDYTTDTKVHAMIAVGDICLAIEEQFQQYIQETMQCLFAACQLTVQPPQNFESDETIVKLRDAIIDAFISIVHGMQGVAQPGSQ
jgi:importin subunit beta-1